MKKQSTQLQDYVDVAGSILLELGRDENSKDVVKMEKFLAEWEEMKNKVEELNNVRIEMLEIKSLLQELLNKKEL